MECLCPSPLFLCANKTNLVGISSISREKLVVPDEVVKHNVCHRSDLVSLFALSLQLCFFCRSGGFIRTCDRCSNFAACFCHEGLDGCLPEWALDAPNFICPNCYKLDSLPTPVCATLFNLFWLTDFFSVSIASTHIGMQQNRLEHGAIDLLLCVP